MSKWDADYDDTGDWANNDAIMLIENVSHLIVDKREQTTIPSVTLKSLASPRTVPTQQYLPSKSFQSPSQHIVAKSLGGGIHLQSRSQLLHDLQLTGWRQVEDAERPK
jgi:hypothetical protein